MFSCAVLHTLDDETPLIVFDAAKLRYLLAG